MKVDIKTLGGTVAALRVGESRWRDAILFIAATIALSWVFWVPGAILSANGADAIGNVFIALGSFVPLAVAFYLNKLTNTPTLAFGRWFRTMTLNRVLVAVVLPILILIPIILWRLYDKSFSLGQFLSDMKALPFAVPGYLILAFGEEAGWRGFVLRRLRNNLFLANFVIAFAWWFWQIPLILALPHDVFLGDAGQHLAAYLLFAILITPFLNRLSVHYEMNVLLSTVLRACLNIGFFLYTLQGPVDLRTHPMGVISLAWLAVLNLLLFGQLWQGKPSGTESELERVMPLEPVVE